MAASLASSVLRALRKSSGMSLVRLHPFSSSPKGRDITESKVNDFGPRSDHNSCIQGKYFKNINLSRQSYSISAGESSLSGFAKALEKFNEREKRSYREHEESNCKDLRGETFSSLLRKTKLMQIGEPSSRVVLGTIIETVGNDLYIDFGGKFHCVCARPDFQPELYHRGVRVKVRLSDMEMTSSFLGSDKHLTLQEADGTIIGIHRSSKTREKLDRHQSV